VALITAINQPAGGADERIFSEDEPLAAPLICAQCF
jgi:hypothetical protein